MLCEQCGKNEAILHLTHIENNQMKSLHLCEPCAAEKGLEAPHEQAPLPLTDFLAKVNRGEPTVAGPCPFCGLKLDEFKKTGRLGCSQCYVTFEPHLSGLLRRLHGSTQHVGKVYLPPDPSHAQQEERLAGLRRKLDHAVQSEDFERAAQLRDQIRNLEGAL